MIGEDLGTVEDGVRERLDARGVLSCRVLLLSEERPHRWPEASLASASTHDLPTLGGLWTGADLADQRAAGVAAKAETAHLRQRLAPTSGPGVADPAEVVAAAHHIVGTAPSTLGGGRPRGPARRATPAEHPLDGPSGELDAAGFPVPVDDLDAALAAVAPVLGRPAPPGPGLPPAAPATPASTSTVPTKVS